MLNKTVSIRRDLDSIGMNQADEEEKISKYYKSRPQNYIKIVC